MPDVMLNCGHCGRFVPSRQADRYAPWGGAADLEPPDDVWLCQPCAAEGYQRVLARCLNEGIAPYDVRPLWVPPSYWFRARAVARSMFRHGTPRPVRHGRARHELTGVRKVWWCACGRPEKHPAHDWDEARRLSIGYCHFEKRVGRNIGTTRVEEWCTCGWSTGALVPDRDSRNVDYLSMGSLLREHIKGAALDACGAMEVAA